MNRELDYTIDNTYDAYRVDSYLKARGYTHKLLTMLRHNMELISVNGSPSMLNVLLHAGDKVHVMIPEEGHSEKIPPIELPFFPVYEDDDIVVVNKPADMPIHPSMNNYENTLGNAAAYYFRECGENFVYRCINRLDRNTTGLTIIAKNALSAGILYEEMRNRGIHRIYTAIVEDDGSLPDSGVIDLPIARVMESAIERQVDMNNGEKAVTNYRVIRRMDGFTDYGNGSGRAVVECILETGRTHQIRVHMSHIGHPLIGDFLYNERNHDMDRQALHAGHLEFTHPVTGKNVILDVPMPEDMAAIV